MSNYQQKAGDLKVSSSSKSERLNDFRPNTHRLGRHGHIARTPLFSRRGHAIKAARKTFAQPLSDLDSSEADEQSDFVRDREDLVDQNPAVHSLFNADISNGMSKDALSIRPAAPAGADFIPVSSPFQHSPARSSVSSARRTPLSRKGNQQLPPPHNSYVSPTQRFLDDSISRKRFTLRKTGVIHSGNKHTSRMIAASTPPSPQKREETSAGIHRVHVEAVSSNPRTHLTADDDVQEGLDHNSDSEGSSVPIPFTIGVETSRSTQIMPLRRAKLKAQKQIQVIRSSGDMDTNDESLGESSESYVGTGLLSRISAQRQWLKWNKRRSWKSKNWRQPPQPWRKKNENKTPVDSAVDVTNTVGSSDGEKEGQGNVLPTQYSHPLAGHENCKTPSALHITNSDEGSIDTGSEDESVLCPAGPSSNLVSALDHLTLPSLRMQKTCQLPFLRRNLRQGFADRCRRLGVPTKPVLHSDKPLEVRISIRLLASGAVVTDDESYLDEYQTRMVSWICPLCDLHGNFTTQTMLQKHIEWDHSEFKTRWTHDHQKSMWAIELYVPKLQIEQETVTVPIRNEIQNGPSQLPSSPLSPTTSSDVSPKSRTIVLPVQESPVYSKLVEQLSHSQDITRSSSRTLSRTRSRSATAMSLQRKTREPSTQPPLEDPLGPSAQYPYLPDSSEDGQVHFSCRPGGPRIYDLLNTLSLAPFGTLSWFIIDREEELFELNEILDEDKVMQALWGRWMLLKRSQFLADYYRGTIAFIDEYWRIIHRAAGWAALRTWLLMFVVNKFLTGSEVAQILRHYEGLTKINLEHSNENS